MNVARLNCSHGDWETKAKWIEWIRDLSPTHAPVAILADLQGPKFRIGDLPTGALNLSPDDEVSLGPGQVVPISQPEILAAMAVGDRLLMGDGEIELRITGADHPIFQAVVVNGGQLKSRKGVTLVGKGFDVPALTEQDREDVQQALRYRVDCIALSYVKHADDLQELRDLVLPTHPEIALCAKIETREAIDHIEAIIATADVLMVARGDMGLQMDIEDVPRYQKLIIDACTRAGKPVITATQMLESMMENSRPTRAEATDVFNAILDGTDALMLSGETAAGNHPIECVRTMDRLATVAESQFDRERIERSFAELARSRMDHTDAIAHAVAELCDLINPAAVVCTSTSGQTARLVSKFRPTVPIYCATTRAATLHKMAFVWGVTASPMPPYNTTDDAVTHAVKHFQDAGFLGVGSCVIVTAGIPVGVPGNTNLIQVVTL